MIRERRGRGLGVSSGRRLGDEECRQSKRDTEESRQEYREMQPKVEAKATRGA